MFSVQGHGKGLYEFVEGSSLVDFIDDFWGEFQLDEIFKYHHNARIFISIDDLDKHRYEPQCKIYLVVVTAIVQNFYEILDLFLLTLAVQPSLYDHLEELDHLLLAKQGQFSLLHAAHP